MNAATTVIESGLQQLGIKSHKNENSKEEDIKKNMQSNNELLQIKAMEEVILLIGQNSISKAREFYSIIIKLVKSKNIRIKFMIFLIIKQFIKVELDLSLLAVNSIQYTINSSNDKDLKQICLKYFSEFCAIKEVSNLVFDNMVKHLNDNSTLFMQRTSAFGLVKMLENIDNKEIEKRIEKEIIKNILNNNNKQIVYGSLLTVLLDNVYNDARSVEFFLKNFGEITKNIEKMESYSQLNILYWTNIVYKINLDINKQIHQPEFVGELIKEKNIFNIDKLIDSCGAKLITSLNKGVCIESANLMLKSNQAKNRRLGIEHLLCFVNDISLDVQLIALKLIESHINNTSEEGFGEHWSCFIIDLSHGNSKCNKKKIKILGNIANKENTTCILNEFDYLIKHHQSKTDEKNEPIIEEVFNSIYKICQSNPSFSGSIFRNIIKLLKVKNTRIVSPALLFVSKMLITESHNIKKNINILISTFVECNLNSKAKTTLIDCFSRFYDVCLKSDSVQLLLDELERVFVEQSYETKLSILILVSRLKMYNDNQPQKIDTIDKTFEKIFCASYYDSNYDVRCRSRFLKNLIEHQNKQLIDELVMAGTDVSAEKYALQNVQLAQTTFVSFLMQKQLQSVTDVTKIETHMKHNNNLADLLNQQETPTANNVSSHNKNQHLNNSPKLKKEYNNDNLDDFYATSSDDNALPSIASNKSVSQNVELSHSEDEQDSLYASS